MLAWLASAVVSIAAQAAAPEPRLLYRADAIGPQQLGILVNQNDPLSVASAAEYARRHEIPAANIVSLRFAADRSALGPEQFNELYRDVRNRMPAGVQALLLTWLQPYRVGCMSMTSAFAFGYSESRCARRPPGKPCGPTQPSPWFQSNETRPWTRLAVRPTMMLGAPDVATARALIGRGLHAPGGKGGTAYLMSTSDAARNARAPRFALTRQLFGSWLDVRILASDRLENRHDVMFYVTGLTRVDGLDTLTFLPGAVADHLTSFGGQLTDSSQMSAVEWIRAGATGSYGTVLEPCAMPQKFPDPPTLMQFYLAGETLIESYWKSVAWPAEGLFLGDPLARPFPGWRLRTTPSGSWFELPWLRPGLWLFEASSSPMGPFRPVARLRSPGDGVQIRLQAPLSPWYRLRPADAP